MKKHRNVGIFLSYVYFVLSTIIGIFLSSFIIRSIGKTDYGVYQSMTAFVSYLALLEFGTGTVMSRNLSLLKKDGTDTEEIKKNVSTIWTLTCLLTFVICLFAVLFYFLIPYIYESSLTTEQIALGKRLFIFAAVSLLFSFFQQMLNGILIGNEIYVFEKALSIIKLVLRAALLVILLSIKPSIYLLVIVDSSLSFALLAITYIFVKIKLHYRFSFYWFDKVIFKSITPLCLALLLQTIINSVNGNVDKFLISVMKTPEDVTIYSVAMMMFSMYTTIATLPVTMFKPQVAKNILAGLQGKELTETLVQPCRLNVLVTGLIAFGFAAVGKQFIFVLYGEDYLNAWICALIVIFPTFVNMSNAVIINVLDIINKRHVMSLILMVSTIVNILLTIFGIKFFGIIGAAVATAASLVIQIVSLNVYYSRKIGLSISYLFKKAFKGILIPLVISFGASFALSFFISNNIICFFACGSLFVVLFIILFFIFGANEKEVSFVKKLFKKNNRVS